MKPNKPISKNVSAVLTSWATTQVRVSVSLDFATTCWPMSSLFSARWAGHLWMLVGVVNTKDHTVWVADICNDAVVVVRLAVIFLS